MSRPANPVLFLVLIAAVCGLTAPAAQGAEARLLTQVDIDGMGGPNFQGGVGDYLLRNDRLDAVILAVGVTPDGVETIPGVSGSYFSNGIVPGGGILIDAMTPGDRNDQFQTVVQNVNLISLQGTVEYRGPEAGFGAPELTSGPTATVTVHGAVDVTVQGQKISSVENPTVTATTTYSLTDGQPWINISTTLTNTLPNPVPIFTTGDEIRYARNGLMFQPFPFRGSYRPPIVPVPPVLFQSFGVYPWFPMVGLHDLGEAAADAVPGICYSIVANSLAEPVYGYASNRRALTTKLFPLGGPPPTFGAIPPGGTLNHDRRFVVAKGNSVEDCADVVMPLLWQPVLGSDARATYEGRVVTPSGDPIANATLFFDNTSPGFPTDPALNNLVTVIDLNVDGQADEVRPAAPGSPVPSTHVRTDADGRFAVRLQAVVDPAAEATVYSGTVNAANRPSVDLPPLTVDTSTIATGVNLGDIVLAGTGTLDATVMRRARGGKVPVPAQITIFGTNGTNNPDFGDQFMPRTKFTGLSQREGDGGAVLTRSSSRDMSNAQRGYPAVNVDASHDGLFSLELAPGTYEIVASRGPEYTLASTELTITEGETTKAQLTLRRVVRTPGWVSVDGHVHAAPSNDSGAPVTDRVVSMLASGVQTIISTEHDQIADYAPQIQALGMEYEITSVIGNEFSAENAVPVSDLTDGQPAFPATVGHIIGYPLSVIDGARRHGAPMDEQLLAATVFDRIRGMDSLPELGATPDTATLNQWLAAIQAGQPGTPGESLPADEDVVVWAHPRATTTLGPWRNFGGMGYDPTLPVDAFPNTLANLRSNYHSDYVGAGGTDTRGLDFDAFEALSSTLVDWYLLTRADWFSLLNQGIHKAAVAGSDTHRPVIDGAGYPRFYAACDPNRRHCTEEELVSSVKNLRVVGSTGPFIRFNVVGNGENAGGPIVSRVGETIKATRRTVRLQIEVTAAPWIPVEEIRIYRNGALYDTIDIAPGKVMGGPVRRFRRTIPLRDVAGDSYFVVEAGSKLNPLNDMGGFDAGAAVNTDLLETMRRITTDDMISLAYTNPIFVDRDGGGYQPPGLSDSSSGVVTSPETDAGRSSSDELDEFASEQ